MSLSMHTISVPVFLRVLRNMHSFLEKAEAYAKERGFDADVLVGARLAPDMLPLSFQVQTATDGVKGCLCRLTGRDIPSWPDNEKTIGELKARLQKAIAFASGFSEADLAASATRMVSVRISGEDRQISGQAYLLERVLPNFYFHATTLYALLRHNGVPLGKRDFLAAS
jgi:hypothetical protein